MQSELLSLARSGGTRNALTKSDLESLRIQVPRSVEAQEAIASILATFDDRIELDRRISETLEAMVQVTTYGASQPQAASCNLARR